MDDGCRAGRSSEQLAMNVATDAESSAYGGKPHCADEMCHTSLRRLHAVVQPFVALYCLNAVDGSIKNSWPLIQHPIHSTAVRPWSAEAPWLEVVSHLAASTFDCAVPWVTPCISTARVLGRVVAGLQWHRARRCFVYARVEKSGVLHD